MRHLIDTYIQADEPRKISPFDNIGLLDLIVKTGIGDAIAAKLAEMKGNKDAIAESIENNVRSKILKEHLSDPAFFEKMSDLLDEVIEARRAKAIEYEDYLQRMAELVERIQRGHSDGIPPRLDTEGKRRLYNNLLKTPYEQPPTWVGDAAAWQAMSPEQRAEDLAIRIDAAIKLVRSDGWRDVEARERVIKAEIYRVLPDVAEVERIFLIVKAQSEY